MTGYDSLENTFPPRRLPHRTASHWGVQLRTGHGQEDLHLLKVLKAFQDSYFCAQGYTGY